MVSTTKSRVDRAAGPVPSYRELWQSFCALTDVRTVGELCDVNRVVLEITSKPPGRSSGSEAAGSGCRDYLKVGQLDDTELARRVASRPRPHADLAAIVTRSNAASAPAAGSTRSGPLSALPLIRS